MIKTLLFNNKKVLAAQVFLRSISVAFKIAGVAFVGLLLSAYEDGKLDQKKIVGAVIAIIAFQIIRLIFWFIADFTFVTHVYPIAYKFRKTVFANIWKYKYEDFIKKPTGKIASNFNSAYVELLELLRMGSWEFIPVVSFSFFLVFSNLFLVWQNSVIYAVFLFLFFFQVRHQANKTYKATHVYSDTKNLNDGRTFDATSNFVNVFSFRAHKKENSKLYRNQMELLEVHQTSFRKNINLYMTSWFSMIVALTTVMTLNTWLLFNGSISFAKYAVSVTLLLNFIDYCGQIIGLLSSFIRAKSSFDQNMEYLFETQNVLELPEPNFDVTNKSFTKSIELKDANFSYPDADGGSALLNINLKIQKDEKIGVVGASGAGKSTLVKLLLGFYNFDSGEVLVDDQKVSSSELASLISYVPQDTTLFQETIEYNIRYAVDDLSEQSDGLEVVKSAAEQAHIGDFIESLPDKFETLVGERGVKLSMGQRQRVAIARAFLKNSDLLIMDEATSALDSRTEKFIQESLEELWKNKTVIAIAHRLSTLNNVDRIVVMKDGVIVEVGSKEELLATESEFRSLWDHQKNGMI